MILIMKLSYLLICLLVACALGGVNSHNCTDAYCNTCTTDNCTSCCTACEPLYYITNSTCSGCAPGTYSNGISACLACTSNCDICASETSCGTCNSGYNVDISGNCTVECSPNCILCTNASTCT